MTKYIFVTGGVVSGLGKGITAASLGRLLKERGLTVTAQKLDPYINVDPGTINPFQHGEVFVTEDGAETDLDLGHYERFIDEDLNQYSNLTSGKVYWNVLSKERNGDYLGETVQVIPHITNEIKEFIYSVSKKSNADIVITEIGGTIGDIESQPFLEAIRQVPLEVGKENCINIHVTLVPFIKCSNEHKSKPTQHSVKELRSMGITPDIIIARSDYQIAREILDKISLFCSVKPDCVIENYTLPILYQAPIMLHENGLDKVVCRELGLNTPQPDLSVWRNMIHKIQTTDKTVTIGIVGKYVRLHDAYLSVSEALHHAGYELGTKININWIDSEEITPANVSEMLEDCNGILVPGGFGNRGIEGKITACNYARERNIPYFGICLGMQIAVIEFARSVCGLTKATSGEFAEEIDKNGDADLVIDLMPDQIEETRKGGTMRLGRYICKIKENSILSKAYQSELIGERHRHRYEFNNNYRELMESSGLLISGTSPDDHIVEVVEYPQNDFFVGVQFHPEFKSRPNKAHPLFIEFVRASLKK